MNRRFRNSIDGVEGIPFKMIIIAVVLAITLPVSFDRFNHWDADRTETDLKIEIQGLISRVKLAYLSGEGNTDNVEVNFRSGMMTRIESVTLGSGPDGIWSGISYNISGRQEQTLLVQDPEIPMAESQGDGFGGLVLGPGKHMIHLSIRHEPQFELGRSVDLFVEVSAVG